MLKLKFGISKIKSLMLKDSSFFKLFVDLLVDFDTPKLYFLELVLDMLLYKL